MSTADRWYPTSFQPRCARVSQDRMQVFQGQRIALSSGTWGFSREDGQASLNAALGEARRLRRQVAAWLGAAGGRVVSPSQGEAVHLVFLALPPETEAPAAEAWAPDPPGQKFSVLLACDGKRESYLLARCLHDAFLALPGVTSEGIGEWKGRGRAQPLFRGGNTVLVGFRSGWSALQAGAVLGDECPGEGKRGRGRGGAPGRGPWARQMMWRQLAWATFRGLQRFFDGKASGKTPFFFAPLP